MTDELNPQARDGLIVWAQSVLADGKIEKTEDIAVTRYSYVARLTAAGQCYYLKKTPPGLFMEASILKALRNKCHVGSIPVLVAADESRHCFLMKACGDETLRGFFSGGLKVDLLVQGIARYREIQRATSPHLQAFMDIGVPDWRLNRLPGFYDDILRDEAALKQWGLDAQDCRKLRERQGVFSRLCADLAAYDIPDALNHSDFQDNNMVIDHATGKVAIIDWGEVTIGNPLLPAIGCMQKACARYKLAPDDPAYKALQGCLPESWDVPAPEFSRVYMLASALSYIYYVFTLKALMENTQHGFPQWGDRMKSGFRFFIDATP